MINIEPTGAISPIKKPIRIDISNKKHKQPSSKNSHEGKEKVTHSDENEVQHIDEIV